jgi:hypothetical protein
MNTTLDDSHPWDESGEVAVCRDCRVEGYSDEPKAFTPCPGPPKPRTVPAKKATVCWATMDSRDTPGHTHLCELPPHEGDHMCFECRRRFGKL